MVKCSFASKQQQRVALAKMFNKQHNLKANSKGVYTYKHHRHVGNKVKVIDNLNQQIKDLTISNIILRKALEKAKASNQVVL